jgi:hypothetical protein
MVDRKKIVGTVRLAMGTDGILPAVNQQDRSQEVQAGGYDITGSNVPPRASRSARLQYAFIVFHDQTGVRSCKGDQPLLVSG